MFADYIPVGAVKMSITMKIKCNLTNCSVVHVTIFTAQKNVLCNKMELLAHKNELHDSNSDETFKKQVFPNSRSSPNVGLENVWSKRSEPKTFRRRLKC